MNSVGESSRSNERSATPVAPATVPGAPSLAVVAAGNASVNLSWNAPVLERRLARSPATGSTAAPPSGGETLLTTLGMVTSYLDTSVLNGTTYYYQVSAINAVGEGPRSSEWPATPVAPATAPGAPTLNSATPGNAQRRPLLERALLGRRLGDHRLQRLPRHLERRREPAGDARHRDGLDGHRRRRTASTYYYQVSAINSVGESSRSSERSATPVAPATVPGTPTLNSATRRQRQRRARLERPELDGGSAITGYKLYRGTASGGETLCANLGTVTSWTDTGVTNGDDLLLPGDRRELGRRRRPLRTSAPPPRPRRHRARRADAERGRRPATAASPSPGARPSDGGSAITATRSTARTSTRQRDAARHARHRHQLDGHRRHQRHDLLLPGDRRELGRRGLPLRASARRPRPRPPPCPARRRSTPPSAGNGSVALAWSAPSSDGGAAITGYKVYRGTVERQRDALATLGAVTSYTDTSVTNGTTYYYQVTAVNAVGEGARSSERSATPAAPATAPGAPTLNSATAGNGSVALAWSAPSSDGGSAITGYRIYRGTASGGEIAAARRSATSRAGRDTGVTNGTTYYYQVSAVNSVGEGLRSNERSATPDRRPRPCPARRR